MIVEIFDVLLMFDCVEEIKKRLRLGMLKCNIFFFVVIINYFTKRFWLWFHSLIYTPDYYTPYKNDL